MSTASFDKAFVVTDPKAIEQFLYDLDHAERPAYLNQTPESQKNPQPDTKTAFEILKARLAKQP